jgi:hypothetical protein
VGSDVGRGVGWLTFDKLEATEGLRLYPGGSVEAFQVEVYWDFYTAIYVHTGDGAGDEEGIRFIPSFWFAFSLT